jgi:hypothetical protein
MWKLLAGQATPMLPSCRCTPNPYDDGDVILMCLSSVGFVPHLIQCASLYAACVCVCAVQSQLDAPDLAFTAPTVTFLLFGMQ